MTEPQNTPHAADTPPTEEMSWTALYGRIRTLAYRRSAAIARDEEVNEEKYDRCARALRTLMGAAEIAVRMKREDEKEQDGNAACKEPEITDEQIEAVYRTVERRIDRIEKEGDKARDS